MTTGLYLFMGGSVPMKVSFYDFQSLHPSPFLQTIQDTFGTILKESSFIDGQYNKSFEALLADFVGAKHAKLVANCTDALEMALKISGIGHHDFVAVPSVTFHASSECILNVGAIPILIDVHPETGLIDPASLERMAKQFPIKAVIPVHIYGMPAPMQEILAVAKKYSMVVIEDAAQAIGTTFPNSQQRVGNSLHMTTFSFYPTKNLGAFGDAGAITTNDDELAKKIMIERNHGRSAEGLHHFGRNSRCDHLQAAVLALKMPFLTEQNQARVQVAQRYIQGLASFPEIKIPGSSFLKESSWHLFPILLPHAEMRLKIHQHLKELGIQTMMFYERSLGDEIPMKSFQGEQSMARSFTSKVLCLPMHPYLSHEQIDYVLSTLTSSLKSYAAN
jgi:dTDP-4-amino-4,6-dideoxygalactose transaminase